MTVAPFRPERFETAVDPYVKYRLRYAPALLDWLAEEARLTAGSRLLDLGCGPGFIGNAMAVRCGEVIGVDPSPAMLASARAEAPANATFFEGSSYDLSMVPAPVQLVTMGRSFHWMDRAATLVALDGLVADRGLLALLGDRPAPGPGNAWWRAANEVALAFAEIDDCARLRRSDDWEPHETVLLRSPFADLRRVAVFARHEWTYQAVLGNILSRSGNTEELLGERRAEMESALREALAPFGPGPWQSLNEHSALIARRAR